jgi:uncharacterized protein (DUF1684 family)
MASIPAIREERATMFKDSRKVVISKAEITRIWKSGRGWWLEKSGEVRSGVDVLIIICPPIEDQTRPAETLTTCHVQSPHRIAKQFGEMCAEERGKFPGLQVFTKTKQTRRAQRFQPSREKCLQQSLSHGTDIQTLEFDSDQRGRLQGTRKA